LTVAREVTVHSPLYLRTTAITLIEGHITPLSSIQDAELG